MPDHRAGLVWTCLATLSVAAATMCIQLDKPNTDLKLTPPPLAPANELKLRETLLTVDQLDFLIAWNNHDLTILAAKDVQQLGLRLPDVVFFQRPADVTNWFALLCLAKE